MKIKYPLKDKRLLLYLREERGQESISTSLSNTHALPSDLVNKYLDRPNQKLPSSNEE